MPSPPWSQAKPRVAGRGHCFSGSSSELHAAIATDFRGVRVALVRMVQLREFRDSLS